MALINSLCCIVSFYSFIANVCIHNCFVTACFMHPQLWYSHSCTTHVNVTRDKTKNCLAMTNLDRLQTS